MAIDVKTTLARVAAGLLLAGTATAHAAVGEPEIREQPTDVRRPQVVQIEWAGKPAHVVVEHKRSLEWVTEGDDETGSVLVEPAGEGAWSARWQSSYYSPSGTYRIRVEGEDYSLKSNEFKVRPCTSCLFPSQLRKRWDGDRFRVSMTANYARGPADGWLELPTRVTTGRPLVRVLRDGRRVGSILLRYRRGRFRGTWPGPRGPQNSVVFKLVALADGFGNS